MKAEFEARGHHPYRHPLQRSHPPNVPEHPAGDQVTYIAPKTETINKRKDPLPLSEGLGVTCERKRELKAGTAGRLSASGTS